MRRARIKTFISWPVMFSPKSARATSERRNDSCVETRIFCSDLEIRYSNPLPVRTRISSKFHHQSLEDLRSRGFFAMRVQYCVLQPRFVNDPSIPLEVFAHGKNQTARQRGLCVRRLWRLFLWRVPLYSKQRYQWGISCNVPP